MSNEESRDIKDTRGRPRNNTMVYLTDQVKQAYWENRLPFRHKTTSPRKDAKRLRLSLSFKEIQEELDIKFRVLSTDDGVVVCLRKG